MEYQFDDVYSAVYYLDGKSYIYLGSYSQIGIRSNMRDATKIRLADDYNDRQTIVDDKEHERLVGTYLGR